MGDSSATKDPASQADVTAGERWEIDGRKYGYVMPRAARWMRLPIIRHVRAIWLKILVERHYAMWAGVGVRTGYDDWVVNGIWHGKERPL